MQHTSCLHNVINLEEAADDMEDQATGDAAVEEPQGSHPFPNAAAQQPQIKLKKAQDVDHTILNYLKTKKMNTSRPQDDIGHFFASMASIVRKSPERVQADKNSKYTNLCMRLRWRCCICCQLCHTPQHLSLGPPHPARHGLPWYPVGHPRCYTLDHSTCHPLGHLRCHPLNHPRWHPLGHLRCHLLNHSRWCSLLNPMCPKCPSRDCSTYRPIRNLCSAATWQMVPTPSCNGVIQIKINVVIRPCFNSICFVVNFYSNNKQYYMPQTNGQSFLCSEYCSIESLLLLNIFLHQS